jgi:mRNA interferase RelE/StbE
VAYAISIDPAALREMRKLPTKVRQDVASVIDSLAINPRPPAAKKLSASKSSYRIRIGDYRILYRIADRELSIIVVRVADRKDAYR